MQRLRLEVLKMLKAIHQLPVPPHFHLLSLRCLLYLSNYLEHQAGLVLSQYS